MHLRYIGFLLALSSSIDSVVGGFGDEIRGEAKANNRLSNWKIILTLVVLCQRHSWMQLCLRLLTLLLSLRKFLDSPLLTSENSNLDIVRPIWQLASGKAI